MAHARRTRTAPATIVAKLDFRKTHPELYRTGSAVEEVRVPKGVFLAADGAGEPGGSAFLEAIGRLYTLAYAAKFAMKRAGGADFAVPPLECLWFDDPAARPKDQWRWRLLLRVPPCVSAQGLKLVRRALVEKKGSAPDGVKRITWTEGRALQVLHVGPYDGLGGAYRRLVAEADARTLRAVGPGHEIYLGDPRRAAPERLRTLVRMPVRR